MNIDAEVMESAARFRATLARARCERAARLAGRISSVAHAGNVRDELDRIDARLAHLNRCIRTCEVGANALKVTLTAQRTEQGRVATREPQSPARMTLSDIADRTQRQLTAILDELARLMTDRTELQQRRRELLSGRAR